jgi:hypothetical protein
MPLDEFDALLFYLPRNAKDLPTKRSSKQLYFAGYFYWEFLWHKRMINRISHKI